MHIHQNVQGLSFERGYRIVEARGIGIVGISPGNTYFKESTVQELLTICCQTFSKVYICIPCKPSIHTYKARGYNESKAKTHARKENNLIKNIVKRAVSGLDSSLFHILDWETEVETHIVYNEKLEFMYELYAGLDDFRQEVQITVSQMLANYAIKNGIIITASMLDEGSKYILKEFAFLLASPLLLHTSNIATVYHRKWPIWNAFASGKYTKDIPSIGDVIISKYE